MQKQVLGQHRRQAGGCDRGSCAAGQTVSSRPTLMLLSSFLSLLLALLTRFLWDLRPSAIFSPNWKAALGSVSCLDLCACHSSSVAKLARDVPFSCSSQATRTVVLALPSGVSIASRCGHVGQLLSSRSVCDKTGRTSPSRHL